MLGPLAPVPVPRCHSGWTGQLCNQCVRYPGCLHGTCQKPWECLCDEGWGGLFCNQDLNFCTNHKPCRNGGTCFNTGQGSYTCACAPGFRGTECETPLLDCKAHPCLNQGTCVTAAANSSGLALTAEEREEESLGRRYRCVCPAGWRGRHCELGSRSCRDAPCARGATCENDQELGYQCICPPGLGGPDCERQLDDCAAHPCSNGGTCTDHPSGFRCSCAPGFTGERCQQNIDDCQGEPCLHGATCLDLVNGFSCQCVPGYVGRLCQDKVDYCLAKPCANGGSCLTTTNDYRCSCKPGFAGKDCSVDVDECKSSPCQHGGTCRNRVNGFACECPDGWRGDICAEPLARPGSAGFWQAGRGRSAAAVAASPEARHAALTTEHVVVIATISTAVPAFVLVAALAVMCMKRRQKREQAKADEEARLQNERNAVHSSMSKRAGALLSPQLESASMTMSPPAGPGDSHMIKNTWAAHGQGGLTDRGHGGKSVNNAVAAAVAAAAIAEDGYKPEPVCGGLGGGSGVGIGGASEARPRPTKQLNTEAAAHRASQHLYHKEKECGLGLGLASACQQLLEAKRASALFAGSTTESGCCASSCAEAKRPETPPLGEAQLGSDTPGCAVYVIDDHYRHDSALAATLATEV
jgi:delta-like protein